MFNSTMCGLAVVTGLLAICLGQADMQVGAVILALFSGMLSMAAMAGR